MNSEQLLQEAESLKETIISDRRFLHTHAETGFDLTETKAYVKKKLEEMGYEPKDCGKAGLIALAGGKKEGKVFLIRGDMDALPFKEEADMYKRQDACLRTRYAYFNDAGCCKIIKTA